MAARRNPQPVVTKGGAWGTERVALGLSMGRLSVLSGVNKGELSLIEAGRLVPTAEQWNAVMRVLRQEREAREREAAP